MLQLQLFRQCRMKIDGLADELIDGSVEPSSHERFGTMVAIDK